MAATPDTIVLPITPFAKTGIATAAETAFHNPTNMVAVFLEAANVNGVRLTRVEAAPRAALGGATVANLYKKIGTTYTLIRSVLMADNGTPGAAVSPGLTDFGYSDYSPLLLEAGEGLAFSIGRLVTNGVVCRVEGMAY